MSTATERLLHEALALPDDERLEFVEALIGSLQPKDQPPFDESWRAIVRRRAAELHTGKVASVPWEEVKQRAREKAGG